MSKRNQSGYSLIEVLIAIAITSVVLLTVVTLFYMGRRNVYSGKQMTYAVSVGTRVLEDLSNMTAADVRTNFSIDDNTALGTVNVQGIGAFAGSQMSTASSAGRDTTVCTVNGTPPPAWNCGANDPNNYLAAWKDLLGQSKLTNGVVGLVLTPRNPTNVNAKWTTAQYTKVRAYVQWDEGPGRKRIAYFDTTKVFH
jgi:prepilin-type N-terminal cleavage/methylation domain-containing protein